jgi:hypothetical protein
LAAWFAGFCLITNGAYLAGGLIFPGGEDDAGTIFLHGGTLWQLLLFSFCTVPLGLWIWNGLGVHFGLGAAQGKIDRRAAIGMTAALILIVIGEVVIKSI